MHTSEKNENESEGIMDKQIPRRDFLKLSGKGIAGLALSSSFLAMIGCSSTAKGWATPRGVLVAERARCTGCHRCETACTLLNAQKASSYVARVRIRPHYFFGDDGVGSGGGLYHDLNYTPITCRQCENPECGNICPVNAITFNRRSGVVVVNERRCVGCRACVFACPWEVPVIDHDTNKSTKCNICGECARSCPTAALKIIPWENITV